MPMTKLGFTEPPALLSATLPGSAEYSVAAGLLHQASLGAHDCAMFRYSDPGTTAKWQARFIRDCADALKPFGVEVVPVVAEDMRGEKEAA